MNGSRSCSEYHGNESRSSSVPCELRTEVRLPTLKEFEDALREQGMHTALAVLETLRARDRAARSINPARRVSGRKMTPDLAKRILELHATTDMTQQEIAFQLGVNQGRVNEVIKRGKWLTNDPTAPEAIARDKARARLEPTRRRPEPRGGLKARARASLPRTQQLAFGDF